MVRRLRCLMNLMQVKLFLVQRRERVGIIYMIQLYTYSKNTDFFYLFTAFNHQIFFIHKNMVLSEKPEEFKKFMMQKTGLEWTKPVTLFTLNLKQLLFNKQNTKLMEK